MALQMCNMCNMYNMFNVDCRRRAVHEMIASSAGSGSKIQSTWKLSCRGHRPSAMALWGAGHHDDDFGVSGCRLAAARPREKTNRAGTGEWSNEGHVRRPAGLETRSRDAYDGGGEGFFGRLHGPLAVAVLYLLSCLVYCTAQLSCSNSTSTRKGRRAAVQRLRHQLDLTWLPSVPVTVPVSVESWVHAVPPPFWSTTKSSLHARCSCLFSTLACCTADWVLTHNPRRLSNGVVP